MDLEIFLLVRYNNGDIRTAKSGYIVQGVNSRNSHGSGLAKSISEKWPQVKKEYHKFYSLKGYLGIGEFSIVPVDLELNLHVVNMVTQDNFGYDGKVYVSYSAIEVGLINLCKHIEFNGLEKTIHLPKIGCGLAGGDWSIVSGIISNSTPVDYDVYIWNYK